MFRSQRAAKRRANSLLKFIDANDSGEENDTKDERDDTKHDSTWESDENSSGDEELPEVEEEMEEIDNQGEKTEWKHEELEYLLQSFCPSPPETFTLEPDGDTAGGNFSKPIEFFHYFFPKGLISYITEQSNRYCLQKTGKTLDLTTDELKTFIGIYLYMGLVRQTNVRSYWEEATQVPQVANAMSRNRFLRIARYLHFCDNLSVTSEEKKSKLWKIDPILNVLRKKFLSVTPEERHAVDEMIIPYKGKTSPVRQYLPKKPHKWGFKVWSRCGESGYLYNFIVYQGKEDSLSSDKDLGIIGSTVMKLCEGIPHHKGHKVYGDNPFTSLPLVKKLQDHGIYYLGTIRSNRLPHDASLKTEKEFAKELGAYDQVSSEREKLTLVRWNDNRIVTLLSSYCGSEPLKEARRFDRTSKEFKIITMPHAVEEYNRFMGGVDKLDSLMGISRYSIISKRWYMYLFYYFVNVTVVNAWISYKKNMSVHCLPQKDILLRHFIGQITSDLVHEQSKTVILREHAKRARLSRDCEARFDGVDHLPIWAEKKGKCRLCPNNKTTFIKCKKCNVYLCFVRERNCFEAYHV